MTGWKNWASGELVTEPDLQGYLQDQTVPIFASSAARTASGWVPVNGNRCYLADVDQNQTYRGGAWVTDGNPVGLVGGTPLLGSSAGPGGSFRIVAGTIVMTTDANGKASMALPQSLSGLMVTAVVCNGNDGAPGLVISTSSTVTTGAVPVTAYNSTGTGGVFANQSIRVNYLVIGW